MMLITSSANRKTPRTWCQHPRSRSPSAHPDVLDSESTRWDGLRVVFQDDADGKLKGAAKALPQLDVGHRSHNLRARRSEPSEGQVCALLLAPHVVAASEEALKHLGTRWSPKRPSQWVV